MIKNKACSKCGIILDSSMFYLDKTKKDGLCSTCKHCSNIRAKIWRCDNPEESRAIGKRHDDNNRDKIKSWRLANKDKLNDGMRDARKRLQNWYVRKSLIETDGFSIEQIEQYPEIIETKRLIIKTKRLCKHSQI